MRKELGRDIEKQRKALDSWTLQPEIQCKCEDHGRRLCVEMFGREHEALWISRAKEWGQGSK